jgi:hypothetical protein
MAKYLFHSSLSLVTGARGILYDEALVQSHKGHEVYILYCGGLMTQCFSNLSGDKSKCFICKSNYNQEIEKFKNKINFINLSNLISKDELPELYKTKFNYNSVEDIKSITYRGIHIGLACLSGYITATRNINPEINEDFRFFFNHNLLNSLLTTEAMYRAVNQISPNIVYVYNGRFSDSRPVWEVSLKMGINFIALEAIYGLERSYKMKLNNFLPFSIYENGKNMNELWYSSNVNLEQKKVIGESFFLRRRNSQYCGDKIYSLNQEYGILPKYWNSNKRNIVIFNSSEDEFASIGEEYDKYKLFKDQIAGLWFIKKIFIDQNDVNITLRVHPNLSNVKYSYVTKLHTLESGNFFVIDAKSNISTYSLIDNADLVVVFGSTVGVESVYWGKPTILLASAIYSKLNAFYVPSNTDELKTMLTSNLPSKNREEVLMYGYYWLSTEDWEKDTFIDFQWKSVYIGFGKFNKLIEVNNWKKILYSRRIFFVLNYLKVALVDFIYTLKKNKVRFIIPLKEGHSSNNEIQLK